MVEATIRRIIDNFTRLLREHHIKYEYIVLFGSYARGDYRQDSDLDIAVISSQFGNNRLLERIKLMKISSKIDPRIEPHPISLKDWQEGWKELVFEINKTGIKIPA